MEVASCKVFNQTLMVRCCHAQPYMPTLCTSRALELKFVSHFHLCFIWVIVLSFIVSLIFPQTCYPNFSIDVSDSHFVRFSVNIFHWNYCAHCGVLQWWCDCFDMYRTLLSYIHHTMMSIVFPLYNIVSGNNLKETKELMNASECNNKWNEYILGIKSPWVAVIYLYKNYHMSRVILQKIYGTYIISFLHKHSEAKHHINHNGHYNHKLDFERELCIFSDSKMKPLFQSKSS